MAFEGEQLDVSELDFQQIKRNLISYIQNSDQDFSDWNFDGSNLNALMDVLAYNTHYNAMLAYMAVNESFIDSAQLRSSIVSMAKMLGYTPRSYSAAKAVLDGRFLATDTAPDTYTLERGIRFTTSGSLGAFQFVVLDETIPLNKDPANTNYYITDPDNPIIAYQGRIVTTEYPANGADDAQRYVIPEFNIDISTLKVRVYPTSSKTANPIIYQTISDFTTSGGKGFRISEEINFDEKSAIFFIFENSFGQYEIQFGNGIYGRKVNAGNLIELEYLITEGSAPNGINSRFVLQSNIPPVRSVETLRLRENSRVSGGGGKESNNQLKVNAQNNFVIQNRAVTADDYKNLILSNFQFVDSVSVWGGEDNDPPIYGQSFITIKPKETELNGEYLTEGTKSSILNFLKKKKVLSIIPEIVDPIYINIVLDVLFKYNPNNLSGSSSELVNSIRESVIKVFNDENLNSFDTIFRHSQFQRLVDNYNRSIINSLVRVFVKQSFTLRMIDIGNSLANNFRNTFLEFGVPLEIDDDIALIEVTTGNTRWTEGGKLISIADEKTSDPNLRNLYSYIIEENGSKTRLREVGYLNLEQGALELFGNTLISDESEITISFIAIPKSNDIVGARNLLLNIDVESCNITPEADAIAAGGSSRSVDYKPFSRDR